MVDILFVLYYGSKISFSGVFLDVVFLQVVVFQVGYCNWYGYLYLQVWQCYVVCDIDGLCMDKIGVVVIEIGGDVLNVQIVCIMWLWYWFFVQEVEFLVMVVGVVDVQL